MEFNSAFNPGDKGWVFDGAHVRQRTIGQIRLLFTQSAGIDNEYEIEDSVRQYSGTGFANGFPDNYAPKEPEQVEEYMCVETGIGSGTIYTLGKTIFTTEEECRIVCAERIREKAENDAAAAKWKRDQVLSEEATLRRKLAHIEALKAEVTA